MKRQPSTFRPVPVVIGGVVDFINQKARHRGIVTCITEGIASIAVLGTSGCFFVPVDDLAPVKDSGAIVDALRDRPEIH